LQKFLIINKEPMVEQQVLIKCSI